MTLCDLYVMLSLLILIHLCSKLGIQCIDTAGYRKDNPDPDDTEAYSDEELEGSGSGSLPDISHSKEDEESYISEAKSCPRCQYKDKLVPTGPPTNLTIQVNRELNFGKCRRKIVMYWKPPVNDHNGTLQGFDIIMTYAGKPYKCAELFLKPNRIYGNGTTFTYAHKLSRNETVQDFLITIRNRPCSETSTSIAEFPAVPPEDPKTAECSTLDRDGVTNAEEEVKERSTEKNRHNKHGDDNIKTISGKSVGSFDVILWTSVAITLTAIIAIILICVTKKTKCRGFVAYRDVPLISPAVSHQSVPGTCYDAVNV